MAKPMRTSFEISVAQNMKQANLVVQGSLDNKLTSGDFARKKLVYSIERFLLVSAKLYFGKKI